MSSSPTSLPPRSKSGQKSSKPKAAPKKKKKSAFRSFMKFVLTIIILAVLAVVAYGGYLYWKAEETVLDTGNNTVVAPERAATVKPLTMLILGTDYRPKTGTHLTDVMMVAAFNPKTKSATVVSIPRDTRIELSGYKANKANSYYPAFLSAEKKSGVKAEDEMKAMLGKYLQVDIDYATVLNFQGFVDVVDAVGGVNVNISMDMCYIDNADGTNINLKKGPAKLDGEDALGYVRYRKSSSKCAVRTKESSDIDRNARQNEVLHSLIDQMQSVVGITKVGKVLEAVDDNMSMDIENDQLKNMISAYWNINKDNVKFVPLVGKWKSPYIIVDESELSVARQALQDEINGKSVSQEEPANLDDTQNTNP